MVDIENQIYSKLDTKNNNSQGFCEKHEFNIKFCGMLSFAICLMFFGLCLSQYLKYDLTRN